MKRLISVALVLMSFCTGAPAQKIVFTPQWTPQAQFAGAYVAKEKGFFDEEGLDVEIRHIGRTSTVSALDMLLSGETQFITMQLLQAIVSRSDGLPVVNVLQITQKSGLCCVTREPVSSVSDLDGMTIGRWKTGFAELANVIVDKLGIYVQWIPYFDALSLCINGAVDASLCYTYNELISLQLALGSVPEENILRVDPVKMPCPEDGLYVSEDYYMTNKDDVDKFVRAVKRGWDYAREHRKETVDICMRYIKDAHIVTNRTHQTMMLDEYLALQEVGEGAPVNYAKVTESLYYRLSEDLMSVGYITNIPKYEEMIK